jgi:cytochrome c oxidase subunit 3
MQNWIKYLNQQHPFHMVTPSPWPLLTSFSILALTSSIIIYLHLWRNAGLLKIHFSFLCLLFCIYRWFADVITEATFEGNHTKKVTKGLRFGMILFITSEIMFFFAFFWAFFHSSLIPSIHIGAIWPPHGIVILNPFGLPLLNTIILLSSGISITWAHRSILAGKHRDVTLSLAITIILGLLFTFLQAIEYIEAPFSFNSGIYGSIFFLATGFHGFHVLLGTMFLIVTLLRHIQFHFTKQHHFGFEAAAWYWHFVDVVWLFLFVSIYWWGSDFGL